MARLRRRAGLPQRSLFEPLARKGDDVVDAVASLTPDDHVGDRESPEGVKACAGAGEVVVDDQAPPRSVSWGRFARATIASIQPRCLGSTSQVLFRVESRTLFIAGLFEPVFHGKYFSWKYFSRHAACAPNGLCHLIPEIIRTIRPMWHLRAYTLDESPLRIP